MNPYIEIRLEKLEYDDASMPHVCTLILMVKLEGNHESLKFLKEATSDCDESEDQKKYCVGVECKSCFEWEDGELWDSVEFTKRTFEKDEIDVISRYETNHSQCLDRSFRVSEKVMDLNDLTGLLKRGTCPSNVIHRNYEKIFNVSHARSRYE